MCVSVCVTDVLFIHSERFVRVISILSGTPMCTFISVTPNTALFAQRFYVRVSVLVLCGSAECTCVVALFLATAAQCGSE